MFSFYSNCRFKDFYYSFYVVLNVKLKERIYGYIRSLEAVSYSWEQRKLGEISESFEYGLNAAAKEHDGSNEYLLSNSLLRIMKTLYF